MDDFEECHIEMEGIMIRITRKAEDWLNYSRERKNRTLSPSPKERESLLDNQFALMM